MWVHPFPRAREGEDRCVAETASGRCPKKALTEGKCRIHGGRSFRRKDFQAIYGVGELSAVKITEAGYRSLGDLRDVRDADLDRLGITKRSLAALRRFLREHEELAHVR